MPIPGPEVLPGARPSVPPRQHPGHNLDAVCGSLRLDLQEAALLHLWTSRLDLGTERQRLALSDLSAAVEHRFPVAG